MSMSVLCFLQELSQLRQEKQLLNNEKSQTAHKLQSVMADYEREKQEKFELKVS